MDITKLIEEMRAGLEKVNHGPHQLDITNEDRCSGLIDHIWRCSPANIAALLTEIDRLRAEMRRRGKELIRKRSTIANIVYGMEDEGDRVFFGSTNDADQLRALSECLDDFALRQEEVNAIDWPKLATERYAEVERLRAELAGQRMCVNCGKYAPAGHDRTQPLPECVGPDDMAACTFDLTPSEAWQHWSEIAHGLRADNARLRDAIAPLAEKFLWPDDSYDPDAVRADPDWDEEANEGTADDVWITRGDIRRARTAMEASNGK